MWQNNEESRGPDGKLNIAARPVAGDDIFGMLTELNEQCLALLAEQAQRPIPPTPPMFRELVDLWSQLDATSRRRAAACPYLLMDAGFCDPYRWQWLSDQHANARAGVKDTLLAPLIFSKFFTAPSLVQVARQVFTHAWHIAQSQPLGATLFLGMPGHCVSLLRTCSIGQLTDLAEQHSGWLRPRWPGRPKVWRQLLEAGISGDPNQLEMARLHGVQLLAVELKAMDRLKGLGLAR
jgi:hypothetical protein